MADSINKPKVFLSHSSIDKPFINKLDDDLKKFKIDTWLDTEEIRDGRPWMKVIFEDGIPTCDAVIVYLTENSIGSKMVKKELDVALLHQLGNEGVVVLPYVSDASVRSHLRPDLQTLQCRVWNAQNYQELLPSVVAEIWRSYLERRVATAVSKEKVRRLELELENQQLKQAKEQTVFTQKEEKDFDYIRQVLVKSIEVRASYWRNNVPDAGAGANIKRTDVFEVSLLGLLISSHDKDQDIINHRRLQDSLTDILKEAGFPAIVDGAKFDYGEVSLPSDIISKLQTYGLLGQKVTITKSFLGKTYNDDVCHLTEKMFRFRYWLDYKSLDSEKLNIKYIGLED